MGVYKVTVEVKGYAIVILDDAQDEDDACRVARHVAEMGNADALHLEYEAVRAAEVLP